MVVWASLGSITLIVEARDKLRNAISSRVLTFAVVAGVASLGCAAYSTSYLPPVRGLDESAQITVIRNKNIFGAGVRVPLLLDGFEIAMMRVGQYVTFSVSDGVHAVGPRSTQLSLPFVRGEQYFFMVSPAGSSGTVEIERMTPEDASKRIAVSTRITPRGH